MFAGSTGPLVRPRPRRAEPAALQPPHSSSPGRIQMVDPPKGSRIYTIGVLEFRIGELIMYCITPCHTMLYYAYAELAALLLRSFEGGLGSVQARCERDARHPGARRLAEQPQHRAVRGARVARGHVSQDAHYGLVCVIVSQDAHHVWCMSLFLLAGMI